MLDWHSGFCGATELEFIRYKSELEYHREYNLSKEPLRIDLLVIKKKTDVVIDTDIGRLFRQHNVLEYKSPEDSLTIDDLYKTIGYACLYKGLGETVDCIPADQLTVTLVREKFPAGLMERLSVTQTYDGVYYVENMPFPCQIVVTSQLGSGHAGLRVLSRDAREADIREFISQSKGLTTPGDRNNADAVLEISVNANREMYKRIREEAADMCEALRELMKDEIEAEKAKAVAEARAEAAAAKAAAAEATAKAAAAEATAKAAAAAEALENTRRMNLHNVRALIKSFGVSAEKAMDTLAIPQEARAELLAAL